MNSKELNFPVLTFRRSDVMEFIMDNEHLVGCNALGLKKGCHTNLNIVDSGGNYYLVKSAIKIGNRGCFWGYNIFFNRKIRVQLNFDNVVKKISLNELKEMIMDNFEENRSFYESGIDYFQFQERVSNSESISALINKIGEIFQ